MRLTGTSPHMVIDYVLLYVHTMVTQEISIIVVYWGINRKKMGDMRSYSMLHSDISYDVTIFCWVNNTNDGKDSFVCFDNNFDLNKSLVLFDKTNNVAFLLVATAWCFRLRSQGPVGLREIISAMDGVYVDSCWFNGNIPWNLGLKNIGLIYDRYLQAIGSCCMAIDWVYQTMASKDCHWNPSEMFISIAVFQQPGCFWVVCFFLGNNTKVSRSLPAALDVQSLVFAQSSLFGVYGVMFFFP